MNGTVEKFNRRTGYGFIVDDDDKRYFVHRNDISKRLYAGQRVNFEPCECEKGLFARNVRIKEDMEIGSWIEFGDKIVEVISITQSDIIGREVLHMGPYIKLKYGDTIVISKSAMDGVQSPA